jgi:primosomal protein N' (replication factor Y)
LTQVTGRAGRGDKPGEVFIQTYQPRHYSIAHATRQDYVGFYELELKRRETLRFPPHQRLIALMVADKDHDTSQRAARELAGELKARARPYRQDGRLAVFGAVPAPISRLRGRYRWQIVLRGERIGELRAVLEAGLEFWRQRPERARMGLTIDVDPVDLL